MLKTILLPLLFLFSFNILYSQSLLQKPVSISADSLTFKEILSAISKQTGVDFAYSKRKIALDRTFYFKATEEPLEKVLKRLLSEAGLSYQINAKQIALSRKVLRQFTISGFVRDSSSGEVLIGANIYTPQNIRGTNTNVHGFYSLSLPEGQYFLNTSYVGYEDDLDTIALYADQQMDINLSTGNALAEILVLSNHLTSNAALKEQAKIGANKIEAKEIVTTPTLLGENDVMKVAQLQPGIIVGVEGSSGLHVHGGSPDQNLILLDGVPLYNVSHLLGFVSIFNGRAINSASIYKSGIPARYSGRLSSVMDVRMKDGNNQKLHGGISVGLLSGDVYLEGPLKKGKSSFLISARRTWLDIIAASAQLGQQEVKANYKFQDINAKLNFKLSERDRLFASAYSGKDRMFVRFNFPNAIIDSISNVNFGRQELEWGNQAYSLRWNRVINPKLFKNTNFIIGNFNYDLFLNANTLKTPDETELEFDLTAKTNIRDYGIKSDFDFIPNTKHHYRFGAGLIFHNFRPATLTTYIKAPNLESTTIEGAPLVQGREGYLYIEDNINLSNTLELNAGFHFSFFNTDSSFFPRPQFRFRLNHQFTENQSWQFSYSGMAQFIHILQNNSIGLSSDLWVPSTANVKPSYAHQLALGYNAVGKTWFLKLEAYFKDMQNLIEYEDGASLVNSTSNWEERIVKGKGWSYGTAFSFKTSGKRFSHWLSYTLSWSKRRFDAINQGTVFPYKYDRRHNLNIGFTYDWIDKKGKQKSLNLVGVLSSGHWVRLPQESYQSIDGTIIETLSNHNSSRVPIYHRLDISKSTAKTTKRGNLRTWTWGFYNFYGRSNPFDLYISEESPESPKQLIKQSLFPFPLPFVRYQFSF